MRSSAIMHRFLPLVGLGLSLLTAGGCDGPRPPLTRAARGGDLEAITSLLDGGADVNARGPDGSTALTVAVSGGAMTDADLPLLGGCHPATVRALLAHDPTLRLGDNFAGRRALWFAKAHGCTEVVKMVTG